MSLSNQSQLKTRKSLFLRREVLFLNRSWSTGVEIPHREDLKHKPVTLKLLVFNVYIFTVIFTAQLLEAQKDVAFAEPLFIFSLIYLPVLKPQTAVCFSFNQTSVRLLQRFLFFFSAVPNPLILPSSLTHHHHHHRTIR